MDVMLPSSDERPAPFGAGRGGSPTQPNVRSGEHAMPMHALRCPVLLSRPVSAAATGSGGTDP